MISIQTCTLICVDTYLFQILGFLNRFSDPGTFIETIVIPVATIIYASTVADESTFDAIATGLGGFALGLPVDDQAVNFLLRLRLVFDSIENRL